MHTVIVSGVSRPGGERESWGRGTSRWRNDDGVCGGGGVGLERGLGS